jgi:hypothetical protein
MDTTYFGGYAKRLYSIGMESPQMTFFKKQHSDHTPTHYLYAPYHYKISSTDKEIQLYITNEKYHLLEKIELELSFDVLDKIIKNHTYVEFTYNNSKLLYFSLFDLEIIAKMIDDYQNNFCSYVGDKMIFKIGLTKLIEFGSVILTENPVKIRILNNGGYQIDVNLYADAFILGMEEYNRYLQCGMEYNIYQYKVIDLKSNKREHLRLNTNIVVDRIITENTVSNVYMLDKLYDIEYELPFKKDEDGCYKYFCPHTFISKMAGKLIPSQNRFIYAKSDDVKQYKCYIRFSNSLCIIDTESRFGFDSEYNEKELLYKKYVSAIKRGRDLNEIIKDIQNTTNFYPLYQKDDNTYYEGYWFSGLNVNTNYPIPVMGKKNSKEFLSALARYMENNESISYFGSSECRLCQIANGGSEYSIDYLNGKIFFPSGLLHYYRDHSVNPSREFFEAITKWDREHK